MNRIILATLLLAALCLPLLAQDQAAPAMTPEQIEKAKLEEFDVRDKALDVKSDSLNAAERNLNQQIQELQRQIKEHQLNISSTSAASKPNAPTPSSKSKR